MSNHYGHAEDFFEISSGRPSLLLRLVEHFEDGPAVHVGGPLDAGDVEHGGREVDVEHGLGPLRPGREAGPPHEERHLDVELGKRRAFKRF